MPSKVPKLLGQDRALSKWVIKFENLSWDRKIFSGIMLLRDPEYSDLAGGWLIRTHGSLSAMCILIVT